MDTEDLYSFKGGCRDGYFPLGGIVFDAAGNVFGGPRPPDIKIKVWSRIDYDLNMNWSSVLRHCRDHPVRVALLVIVLILIVVLNDR
jgi:hypothetical protein